MVNRRRDDRLPAGRVGRVGVLGHRLAGHHRHPPGQRRVTHDPSQPDWPERAGFIVHQHPHRSSEAKPVDGRRRSVDCSVATAARARTAAGKLQKQAIRASLSSVAVQ
jgi:hypothetical protein